MPAAIRKFRTAIAGYLAFVAALLLAVIASNQAVANSSVIIGLLATSLPALVAWLYVESIAWEGLEQARRIVRGMVSSVAMTLSVAGFLLTLWNFSRLTVVLILVETGVWYLVISGVFYLNQDCGSGSWGGRRPSLGDYVTGPGARNGGERRRRVLVLPTLPGLADLVVRENAPIVVVARSARDGKDAEVMRDIARRAWEFHQGT